MPESENQFLDDSFHIKMISEELHQILSVWRDARRRTLVVERITRLTPGMLRIRFVSPELADFESPAPDDHVKVFLSDVAAGRGMRDYTPRAFNRSEQWLELDFALHDAGPATRWAMNARVGDRLSVGGPRGSTIVADDFDWYLFVADETGLPAIGRWLEELRRGVPVTTVVAVADDAERQRIGTRADWTAHWACRNGAPLSDDPRMLLSAVRALQLPPGDGYIWIAGESAISRTLRDHFVQERGHPSRWLRASGYWVRGAAGAHEDHDGAARHRRGG